MVLQSLFLLILFECSCRIYSKTASLWFGIFTTILYLHLDDIFPWSLNESRFSYYYDVIYYKLNNYLPSPSCTFLFSLSNKYLTHICASTVSWTIHCTICRCYCILDIMDCMIFGDTWAPKMNQQFFRLHSCLMAPCPIHTMQGNAGATSSGKIFINHNPFSWI